MHRPTAPARPTARLPIPVRAGLIPSLCLAAMLGPLSTGLRAEGAEVFASAAELRADLSALMAAGDLEGAMTRFAPPAYRSVGRLRMLGDRIAALPPLDGPAVLMRDETAPDGRRELLAWWAGGVYVYVHLMLHERDDGVQVLDFRMSGDLREATGWW